MSKSTASYLALSCVGFIASAPAYADEPASPADAADADPQRDNDVVVNGQRERRDADPKQVAAPVNTPKSVVVLPKEIIAQTGSTTLQDALRTVPGITFGAAEGGNPIGDRPFIRGFDSQGSIYVDGVRDLGSQTREVFAIDSVQIVRGSDSTLGGRGSAGGTINIISKLPQAETFVTASGSYGQADYKRFSADANVYLGHNAAVRIEGVYHDLDVAGRDAIWQKRWGFAPSITLGLDTPTRLTLGYYYLESHELPDSGIPYLYVCSTRLCNAPVGKTFTAPALGNITTLDGTTGFVDRSNFYGLVDRDFRDAKQQQATMRVEHDFGGITLRNTARYNRSDQAYIFLLPDDSQGNVFGNPTIAPGTINPTTGGTEMVGGGYVWRRGNTRYGYTQSIIDQTDLYGVFNTGGIEHSFAVGTEFSWEKARRGTFVEATGATINPRCDTFTIARYYCTSLFNPNPNDPWVNYASDTSTVQTPIVTDDLSSETQNDANTQAIYAFDSINLLPQLILNLGVRYDRFSSTLTPPGVPQIKLRHIDKLINWQAGLVFKPTPDTSLYASYATAATPPNSLLGEGREDNALPTSGGATNLDLLDSLKPQKTRSYELGAKANVFHERLGLAAAVFQTDIDNARVTSDANTVEFIGQSRIRGAELSATGTILPGWTIFGGYTYLDPKIIDGGFSSLSVAANGPAGATTVLVPSVNTGKQLPQTAKHSFTATTNVTLLKRFQVGGSAIYSSRQYGGYADDRSATQTIAGVVTINPANSELSRGIHGYWRFDARASFALNDHVEIAVNAQNLTDKVYFNQVYTNHYASIAPGRTVFGTVNLKF